MKSIFRLYAKTSKGNDSVLLKELKQLNIKNPRYDQHLNSFYFNCNWTELFDVCFKCMTLEQMYLQIGQKFMVLDEEQCNSELQKLPIKNYLPIGRSLVQNTTLKILLRQNSVHLSEQVLINLLTTTINKEVVKKEYFKNINSDQSSRREFLEEQPLDQRKSLIETHSKRGNDVSYFQIRDAVQRKWDLEDQQREQQTQNQLIQIERRLEELKKTHNRLLIGDISPTPKRGSAGSSENEVKELTLQERLSQSQLQITSLKTELSRLKQFSNENYLASQLSYNPHLVFYMRHNRARLLLKVNKDNLYKHGWKQNVNYGPIRESIAASILHHSRVLEGSDQRKNIKLWDPMCGSGTFGLVAATLLGNIPIRSQVEKLFEFPHWPVYKRAYLEEYWKGQQLLKKERGLSYQIILSDKDRQSINYSIDNFRLLLQNQRAQDPGIENQVQQHPLRNQNGNQGDNSEKHPNSFDKQSHPLFPSATVTSETLELVPGQIGFACGDFEEVMKILKSKSHPTKRQNQDSSSQKTAQANQQTKLTIITNLPYLHGRTQAKSPLNQLVSVYKRFNSMLKQNKDLIENAFIIVDKNVESRSHFLNVSSQKWNLIGDYTSGGMEIGLYAWQQNLIKPNFQETSLVEGQPINSVDEYEKIQGKLSAQDRQLILKKQKSVQRALIQYRNKISQIDRKLYSLPKHLVRHDLHGRRRLMEKRRKRHLQSAYELFARRRDKLIALKQYARQKLEVRMLRRGTVWKSKNLKLFNSTDKIQQYSEEIKELFEKKIETAIKKEEQFQLKRKIKSGDKAETAKHFNKWNNDEKKMVRQIKKSQADSKEANRGRSSSLSQGKRSTGNTKRENLSSNYRKR